MSFVLRIYCNDTLKNVYISNYDKVTIGGSPSDTISLPDSGLSKNQVVIKKNGSITIIGKKIYNREGNRVSGERLYVDNMYTVFGKVPVVLAVHPKQADSKQFVDLKNVDELSIGRDENNSIVLSNKRVSKKHCCIKKAGEKWKITDTDSLNGVYVNGKLIKEAELLDKSVINIGIYDILFIHNALYFHNVGNDITINYKETKPEDDFGWEDSVSETGTIALGKDGNK